MIQWYWIYNYIDPSYLCERSVYYIITHHSFESIDIAVNHCTGVLEICNVFNGGMIAHDIWNMIYGIYHEGLIYEVYIYGITYVSTNHHHLQWDFLQKKIIEEVIQSCCTLTVWYISGLGAPTKLVYLRKQGRRFDHSLGNQYAYSVEIQWRSVNGVVLIVW